MNNFSNYHIAIVEDDNILREELSHFLRSNGLIVSEANNGISLNEILLKETIHIVILDLNLPGQNGFEIAKYLRKSLPSVRIIMITGRTALPDRINGYDSGADIFLPKPISAHELLSAISSIYRRSNDNAPQNCWVLNERLRQISPPNSDLTIPLTFTEAALLVALMKAPNQSLDSNILCEIQASNGDGDDASKRALENSISRLRKKLKTSDGNNPNSIRSVWGHGYQLCIQIINT